MTQLCHRVISLVTLSHPVHWGAIQQLNIPYDWSNNWVTQSLIFIFGRICNEFPILSCFSKSSHKSSLVKPSFYMERDSSRNFHVREQETHKYAHFLLVVSFVGSRFSHLLPQTNVATQNCLSTLYIFNWIGKCSFPIYNEHFPRDNPIIFNNFPQRLVIKGKPQFKI